MALAFGRKRGWFSTEVGAPGPPRWQRTVDFYGRAGFGEIGPRLELKLQRIGVFPRLQRVIALQQ